MANSLVIDPINVEIKTKPSKFGNGSYDTLEITDKDNKVYSCIFKNGMKVPLLNTKMEIIYQEVKGDSGMFNHILELREANQMTKTDNQGLQEKVTGPFKIKGKLYYAHIRKPETTGQYPSNKYKADISISTEYKKSLEKLGVLVKNKDDAKGDFVTVKSKYQPVVSDNDGTVLTDIPLIGNGSEAIITVSLYANKAAGGGAFCLGFSSVELTNLITFEPKLLIED